MSTARGLRQRHRVASFLISLAVSGLAAPDAWALQSCADVAELAGIDALSDDVWQDVSMRLHDTGTGRGRAPLLLIATRPQSSRATDAGMEYLVVAPDRLRASIRALRHLAARRTYTTCSAGLIVLVFTPDTARSRKGTCYSVQLSLQDGQEFTRVLQEAWGDQSAAVNQLRQWSARGMAQPADAVLTTDCR